MVKTVNIMVSGRVQGVCYRASTQKVAHQLGLIGWVKNRPDGCVEIQAQGELEQLEQLIAWCHKGPIFARVDSVNVTDLEVILTTSEFMIRE